ncbi:MAG: pyridoxal phosphate-dependent aminotransferase [Clostridia bacterium]|nr:pyridoxal phosphate-dependent aminotransferase [Clostridia bacterium]
MKYDFDTLVKRNGVGAYKWDAMKRQNPALPEDIVPFSVADMEFKNAPEIVEGLKEYLDTAILGYTGPTEAYFRAVIGFMERNHGFSPKKEWFMEFAGIVPALRQIIGALTEPGDGVMIQTPVYHQFRNVIEFNKCVVVENELIEKDGVYTIDFEDFERKAAREDVKLFVLCSPHNPVGRVWTQEELTRMAEICMKHNVYILDDEIHFDLIMPGYKHVSMLAMDEKYWQNCLVCTSPGKTFNLAGLQASNIFIPDETVYKKIQKYRGGGGLNALSYKAVEFAYDRSEGWMKEMVAYVNENKNFVCNFLAEHLPMITASEMEGTYLIWLDLRRLGLTAEAQEELLQKKAYIFSDAGYIFGKGGEGFERINLACPRHVLKAAMERLEQAVKEM